MEPITVSVSVSLPEEKICHLWTTPEHIMNWNSASEDWHTPRAQNDLMPGGKFVYNMAAKDGSFEFDFSGTYSEVKLHDLITYILDDGRTVRISFRSDGNATLIKEIFDPEATNPIEMQRTGWQAILYNFKRYAESLE